MSLVSGRPPSPLCFSSFRLVWKLSNYWTENCETSCDISLDSKAKLLLNPSVDRGNCQGNDSLSSSVNIFSDTSEKAQNRPEQKCAAKWPKLQVWKRSPCFTTRFNSQVKNISYTATLPACSPITVLGNWSNDSLMDLLMNELTGSESLMLSKAFYITSFWFHSMHGIYSGLRSAVSEFGSDLQTWSKNLGWGF